MISVKACSNVRAGLKDSSNIFPGHGGFLDRIDSWIWGAALGYFVIQFFILLKGGVYASRYDASDPTRNLALELARVTEAAALAAGRFMGRGDKEAADGAAVNAMRIVLQTVDMNGIIVIGEGEKDNAPMLYNGENVGNGSAPDVDVAVDPIDGTRPLAFGRSNSLATVAIAPRGTMFDPGPLST